jgi:hypothetical protein
MNKLVNKESKDDNENKSQQVTIFRNLSVFIILNPE